MSQNAATMSVMKSPDQQPPEQPPQGADIGYDPSKPIMTGMDLLESGLVGMWTDRDDITDNLEFARSLGRHARTVDTERIG